MLNLGWTLRDQNEEADALTNGDYSMFKPTNRVKVVIEEVSWLTLPRMMQVATDIFEDVQRRSQEPGAGAPLEDQGQPPAAGPVVGARGLCGVGCRLVVGMLG